MEDGIIQQIRRAIKAAHILGLKQGVGGQHFDLTLDDIYEKYLEGADIKLPEWITDWLYEV